MKTRSSESLRPGARPKRVAFGGGLAAVLAALLMLQAAPARAHIEDSHHALANLALRYLEKVEAREIVSDGITAQEARLTLQMFRDYRMEMPEANLQRRRDMHLDQGRDATEESWKMIGIDPWFAHPERMSNGPQAPKRDPPLLDTEQRTIIPGQVLETAPAPVLGYLSAHGDEPTDLWIGTSRIYRATRARILGSLPSGPSWGDDAAEVACCVASLGIGCLLTDLCEDAVEAAEAPFEAAGAALATELAKQALMRCETSVAEDILIGLDFAEEGDLDRDAKVWDGVSDDDCEELAQWLPSMDILKSWAFAGSESAITKLVRVRMRDLYDFCKNNGLEIGNECKRVMNTYLAQYQKAITVAEKPYYDPAGLTSWTAMSHFIDLFSPNNTAKAPPRYDFRNPTTVARHIAGLGPNDRLGRRYFIDGYSVFEESDGSGTPFAPRAAGGYQWEGGAIPFHLIGDTGRAGHGETDDKIAHGAAEFGAFVSFRESGNMLMRRRAGCGLLATNDGFPSTDCRATDSKDRFTSKPLPAMANVPAIDAALDGWAMWISGRMPGVPYPGRDREIMPIADYPSAFTNRCSDRRADCDQETTDGIPEYLLGIGQDPSVRLYGLSTMLHMISDLTVPHHLAPTSSFGHNYWENFVKDYLGASADLSDAEDPQHPALPPLYIVRYNAVRRGNNTVALDFTGLEQINRKDLSRQSPMWQQVKSAERELRTLMGELARGKQCAGFAIRRLGLATALRTAAMTQNNAATIHGALLWRDGLMFERDRDDIELWAALEGRMVKTHIGTAEFVRTADGAIANGVATLALIFVNARRALAQEGAMCDSGWQGAGVDPAGVPIVTVAEDDSTRCWEETLARHRAAGATLEHATSLTACECSGLGSSEAQQCVDELTRVWRAQNLLRSECAMGNNAAPECLAAFSRALRRSLAQGMGQPDPYRDTDADGVPDEWDRCPNEPVDARSGQADEVLGALNPVLQDVILERDSPSYGCRTDSDHDGVPDARDLCPRTDPQAGAVDSDGCNAADRQDVLDPVSARVRRQG